MLGPTRPEPVLRAMGTTFKSITEGTFNSVGARFRPRTWPNLLTVRRDQKGELKFERSLPSILTKSGALAHSFHLTVTAREARVATPFVAFNGYFERGVCSPFINKARQDVLNPEGVNCLRFFEGRGNRVWGARTMSSDPEWKYVNVRRLFIFLEASIFRGTQWVVFEPNDQALWAKVRRDVVAFLKVISEKVRFLSAFHNPGLHRFLRRSFSTPLLTPM